MRGVLSAVSASAAPAYAEYLARQGITVWMPRPSAVERLAAGRGNPILHVLASARASTRRAILRLFPQPEAGLLSGILVGDEGAYPELKAFRHRHQFIVAISGFNLSLLSAAVLAAFGAGWAPARAWASAAVILGYTDGRGLSGYPLGDASLGLAARRLGRLNHGLTSPSRRSCSPVRADVAGRHWLPALICRTRDDGPAPPSRRPRRRCAVGAKVKVGLHWRPNFERWLPRRQRCL
jgi:hypothetical protein